MPLTKTPVSRNKKTQEHVTQPNLVDIDVGDTYCTRSRKRGNDEEWSNPLMEIRKVIVELKEEQKQKLDELQSSINAIRQQNEGMIESIEFLTNEYRDLRKHQRKPAPSKNAPSRLAAHLLNTTTTNSDVLNMVVDANSIRDIYRVNTKIDSNKPIIVEFTSVITKEKLIEQCKKFNLQHKNNKLNTSHLNISGPQKSVYISEHLTSRARRLFFLARGFANTNEFKFCWTAGGKVFIRKKEGERLIRINSESDLCNLQDQLKN
ncbi:hypothetical protein SFRURICE_020505 [Spodoptera frugiperda]|nr:hypothetical protein SFRURICE_020505 [Spodoptera frugiperda]